MLAIIFTLKEAAYQWIQIFWYLVVIALVTSVPEKLINTPGLHFASAHSAAALPLVILGLIISIFMPVAGQCAIIGLLARKTEDGATAWETVISTVKKHAWSVLKVDIFWGMCAMWPIFIPLLLHIHMRGFSGLILTVATRVWFYFVLARLTLAVPSVIAEGLTTGDAVKQSWHATRHSLWYALGCLLFANGINQIADTIVFPERLRLSPENVSFISLSAWALGLLASYGTVVQWFIYEHIKSREETPAGDAKLASSV